MNAATSDPTNIRRRRSRHQRRGAAGGDDRPCPPSSREHQREVTRQPGQHRHYGRHEVAGVLARLVLPCHKVHRDLGVGIAGELDADGLQLSAQRREVLDDPVVDDRDLACGVAVRMGVTVGGPAMRGPTGVAEAGAAHEAGVVGFGEIGFEVGEPAGPAVHGQPAVAVDQRDTGRVVSAVLHAAQRVDDDAAGGTLPDVADDSAHRHPG